MTTVRLFRDPSICDAPWLISEDLLRAEGFTDIRYVLVEAGARENELLARGELDFSIFFPASLVFRLYEGLPITVLAGVHTGCFELFAHEPIRTISDLKGKKVGIDVVGAAKYLYVAIMAANIGLDPKEDIEWVAEANADPLELFAQGKVDAFLTWPPEGQELRARKVGHVIVNTTTDKPWSQYFCCMVVGNTDSSATIPSPPSASCEPFSSPTTSAPPNRSEPRSSWSIADSPSTTTTPCRRCRAAVRQWREFDAEDSLRFFGLRLHEAGMIKSSPNALLAEGTDWRFLNELKRELKA